MGSSKMPFMGLMNSRPTTAVFIEFTDSSRKLPVSAGGIIFNQPFQFNPYDSDVPTYSPSSTRDNAAEVSVRSGEETNADIRYRGEPGIASAVR